MLNEHDLAISPLVPESIQHNARVLSNIRSLSASLFGAIAGILGLESYAGFAFYAAGTLLTSLLIFLFRAEGKATKYFFSPISELYIGDVFGGAMGYVLMWTLFYGITRA